MIGVAVFLVLLLILLALFGKDLRDPRRHGFYRFLSFACILALIVRGGGAWIGNPLSPLYGASWLLLLAAVAIVAAGRRALLRGGAAPSGIESTTRVVDSGIYRWIRHPLYLAYLLIAGAALLRRVDGGSLAIFLAAAGMTAATAWVEERECLAKFGAAYAEYMKASKRFLPGVF